MIKTTQHRLLMLNLDVKKADSCLTLGRVDNVLTEATGILTMNQVSVTNLWIGKDINVSQMRNEQG